MSQRAGGVKLKALRFLFKRALQWYRLEEWRTLFRQSVKLNCNWKIAMDAFLETWHVPFTHKDTLSGFVLWRDAILHIHEPHSWMSIPLRGFTETIDSDDVRESHLCHYLAYPNTIFSCFPTHLEMWHVWPIDVDHCELIAYEVVGPPPEGMSQEKWEKRNERDWKSFLEILDEDTAVLKNMHTVIESQGYRRSMFCTAESRLTAFHAENNRRATHGAPSGQEPAPPVSDPSTSSA